MKQYKYYIYAFILFIIFYKKEEVIKVVTNLPRGIRNNNPLNLRDTATVWQGETGQNLDKSFEEFKTPQLGIRAGAKLLLNYQKNYSLYTVNQIINRFAPPTENNTTSYAEHIARALNVGVNDRIVLNQSNLFPMIKAMIKHENGINPYTDEEIKQGISLV